MDQGMMVDLEGLKGFYEIPYSRDRWPLLRKEMEKCNKI